MTDRIATRWLHPGFTRDSVLDYVFKKSIGRVDTSQKTTYYQEAFGPNNLFLDYLATDAIPHTVPGDFVALSTAEIAELFHIQEFEVAEFNSTIDGVSVFSIERSESKPHILRVNNLLMKPHVKNIDRTFTATPSKSRVNLIEHSINSSYGNGGYKFEIKRSGLSGELSKQGLDDIRVQDIAYIYDNDTGYLTFHQEDPNTLNPISQTNPPVISCYIYRGNFGRLGWHIKNNAIVLDEMQLLLGKQTVSDPTLIMDVSGSAFISDLYVNSVTTYSDIRLKENIANADTNYDILKLNPVHYNYKTNPDAREFGLIAQEVEKVAPEIVKPHGEFLSVQYDRLGVHLLPIVREQQARIEKLEAQVAALVKLIHSA
jgi:hypothetical protein